MGSAQSLLHIGVLVATLGYSCCDNAQWVIVFCSIAKSRHLPSSSLRTMVNLPGANREVPMVGGYMGMARRGWTSIGRGFASSATTVMMTVVAQRVSDSRDDHGGPARSG